MCKFNMFIVADFVLFLSKYVVFLGHNLFVLLVPPNLEKVVQVGELSPSTESVLKSMWVSLS